jgi:hypothetical protein
MTSHALIVRIDPVGKTELQAGGTFGYAGEPARTTPRQNPGGDCGSGAIPATVFSSSFVSQTWTGGGHRDY